jgi:hypothetical protein
MPFGVVSTDTESAYKSLNSRRKIFYQFPTGAMPIMGILSALPSEETDKPEFGWWERRFPAQRTTTVASGTAPFLNGDGSAFADTGTMTLDTEYRVNVVSTAQFKPTHVIEIRNVVYTGGATKSIKGTVTEVNSAMVLTFRPYETTAGVENGTTDNNGLTVAIIGTANAEGGRSGQGIIQWPINPTNYTQIFRTAFSITRTALKQGLTFDKSGAYKNMAWENGLRHMIEMEKAVIFGQKHTVLVTDPDTGDQTPETKMGGIIWFLQQWEAANSIYRGGTGAAAIAGTLGANGWSDTNKRIINVAGTMSLKQYNGFISAAFSKTNNKAYEKLVVCGGTFLAAVNDLFESQVTKTVQLMDKNRNVEFVLHSHTTLRGTAHYAVHPLFDEDPDLQGSALVMDMGNLRWRPLTDSDTTFLKGRQETDRDGRKDEWITEGGIELRFPESFMYIYGVTGAA